MSGIIVALVWLALSAPAAMARDVTLNFKDADIRAFIEFVAGFSGRNFLIDNRVKGKVTIISPSPVSEQEAYAVFLSVLEVNGFAAVDAGSVTKIVPRAEGVQKPLPVASAGSRKNDDGLLTEVIRLRYADATQLMAILRPLVPPNSNLSVYPNGNMLLVTDSGANIQRIREVVNLLDRNEAMGVKVFTLAHASAEKVAQALGELYGSGPAQGAMRSVKAMPYQPGNMLIVVAAPQLLSEVIRMVDKLDIAAPSDSGRLYVRYLKNADAEDVAKVITSLISGQSSGTAAPAGGGAPGKTLFTGDVKVVADPATNALLITADAGDRPGLDALIDKLDIRRLQVLVEALIIEITAGGAQQFGMEFRGLQDPNNPARQVIGGTTFSNQAGTNINTVAANPLAPGNGIAVGVVQGTITVGGNTYFNLGALLRALETKTDTNVLSTPNIMTMDNEEAEILVGQNVPFITGTNANTGTANANPFNTVERKDVGLTLRVTPQISEGDTIRLKIYQEISSVVGGTVADGGVTTSKRSIKTTVLANDGSIIVLGGLMRDDNTKSVQRVPCIGSIPVISEPFKFTENSRTKTNLMVFLKPHIIRSKKDIQGITAEKYRDVQDVYDAQKYEGTILFPQEKAPLPQDMTPDAAPDPSAPATAPSTAPVQP